MTYAVWPATLPQAPLPGKFSWGPQRNKVSFQPEIGPSIDRRRGSSTVRNYQVGFDFTSQTMIDTFEEFYADTLLDGTLPFTWVDPLSAVNYIWKFSGDDPPYQINAQRGTYIDVSFKLVRIAVAP